MEIHFDVNRVQAIEIRGHWQTTEIFWCDGVAETRNFFGRIKTVAITPGFYRDRSYEYSSSNNWVKVEVDEILKEWLIRGKEIWAKVYMSINFDHKASIGKKFDTYEEAVEYATLIKGKSKNTFEVITI